MGILDFNEVSFDYQKETLLQNVNFEIYLKDHVCLVGANGAGKTTIFNLILKNLSPDKGKVFIQNNIKIGYLDQYMTIDKDLSGYGYLFGIYKDLFDLENEMNSLYASINEDNVSLHESIMLDAQNIFDKLNDSGFFDIKSNVEKVAIGLGLTQSILEQKITTYSGGMKSKLMLSKILLDDSDIILLDEPTNFLDARHIDWLANFLNNYPRTFIVISHNTDFVNKIAKIILALENHSITKYKGNYDFYLKEKEIRNIKYEKDYKNQQDYIKKAETFINRFLYKATLTTRAQSKRRALEKLEKLPPLKKEHQIKLNFKNSTPSGRDVLITSDLLIGYNDNPLLDKINISIYKENYILISGKNGVGKSTFLKTILDIIKPIDGSYKWNVSTNICYFEQENNYPIDKTPYELASEIYADYLITEVRQLLGSFGIDYDHQNRPLRQLSGGEVTKLRLCLLSKNESNVFVLDEPTNHLDPNMKRALKEALINYKGTVILVSHDKNFYQDLITSEMKFE